MLYTSCPARIRESAPPDAGALEVLAYLKVVCLSHNPRPCIYSLN